VGDAVHERTGDHVSECCHCDAILGPIHDTELPKHWFDNRPRLADGHSVKLARDLLEGGLFESQDKRFVHICGACGHWLTAVQGRYFEQFDSECDEFWKSGLADRLRETMCPECGAHLYRDGSTVAPLQTARGIRANANITRYVRNRADWSFWSGAGTAAPVDRREELEHTLCDHEWVARCPVCGYAVCYGDREFDFHHWKYEDDVGCRLCRRCHTIIHNDKRAKQQSRSTGREWQYDAVERLLNLSEQAGLSFERGHEFISRYNIPESGAARSAVDEVFNDD
jgi:hypothetical protein